MTRKDLAGERLRWVSHGSPMKLLTLVFASMLAGQQKPDIRVDVDLVTVACSVTDHGGAPAKNLKSEDFDLRDNGQPREIRIP
jgi:hypothetical protein